MKPGAWEGDLKLRLEQMSPPIPQPAPTSLPRDGGRVDVETGKFTDFLFRQCVWVRLIYSQFLTMKRGKKSDQF